jgi:hypothetical protein
MTPKRGPVWNLLVESATPRGRGNGHRDDRGPAFDDTGNVILCGTLEARTRAFGAVTVELVDPIMGATSLPRTERAGSSETTSARP